MTTFEILVATYMAVVPAALGALFWSRLNQIETKLDHIASNYVTRVEFRAEIGSLRAEMRDGDTSLRAEMRDGDTSLRAEMSEGFAALHADLTQVALAVGARPRASEG
ncbi:MAG: hypothetical protein M3277_08740 [Actinomycetota bacterium]|nr:hypothetical protein [Actinomycetota bacterium]